MTPTPDDTTRPRAELVRLKNRNVSPLGWRHDFFEEHLLEHLSFPPSAQWCQIGCMARTMWGRNTPTNQVGVRRRLARAFLTMLRRHQLVVIEYAHGKGTHGEALAIKLYRRGDLERETAQYQLDRMRRRKEISAETLEAAQRVLDSRSVRDCGLVTG